MDNDRNYANMSEVAVIGAATSVIAAGVAVLDILRYRIRIRIPYIPRAPHVNRDQARENYINSILYASSKHCIGQIRMSPMAFSKLCDTLTQRGFVQPTIHMTVREQVMIFLHIVGHNVRFRVIGSRFHRSTETIHRYFLIVLNAILKLYPELVRLPSGSTPSEIRNNRRFYPWFSDCVGAIDGTHIRASVPMEHQGRFRGRKGMTSQNVLAVVTFDLKFAYVLAGWEGSAHDSCVLNDALSRPEGLQVPEGKYYLANASYGIRRGFIPPFRGVRYHLKEYSNHEPENEKELVNHRHSSLRTTVERGFGVLKKRFRVLGAEPFYKYELQVDVVLACCVPHNFIMEVDPNDRIMRRVNRRFQPRQRIAQRTQRQEREESREWTRKRKAITDVIERGLMLGVEIVTDRQLKTHAKVETLYVMEQMNEMGVSDIPLLLPTPLAENKDISRIVPIIQTFFGALIHLLRPKMQKVMKRYNDGWNEEYKKICRVHDKDSDDSNDMPPSLGEELFARDESGSKSSSKSSTSSDAGYGKEDYEDYDEEFEGYGEEYKD